jgi:hypothetical protein
MIPFNRVCIDRYIHSCVRSQRTQCDPRKLCLYLPLSVWFFCAKQWHSEWSIHVEHADSVVHLCIDKQTLVSDCLHGVLYRTSMVCIHVRYSLAWGRSTRILITSSSTRVACPRYVKYSERFTTTCLKLTSNWNMCHMSPMFHPISIYLPNIEDAYLTKICNDIVKRLTDKHCAFGTGYLGNHSTVSSDVCIIRISYNAWGPYGYGFTVSFPLRAANRHVIWNTEFELIIFWINISIIERNKFVCKLGRFWTR